MKAVYRKNYGPIESIKIGEFEEPELSDNSVLVKVKYTTVNRTDCGVLTGKPFVFRFFVGFPKPKYSVLGTDFSGTVEKVGKKVEGFKVGDSVFGFHDEGLPSQAEYISIKDTGCIENLPPEIDLIKAAASLEGAHYALNGIKNIKITKDDPVLVNGATGAIGSAVIQFLKNKGAHVTAVCGGEYFDRIKELGADELIDYKKVDFTSVEGSYRYIIDAVGKSRFKKCKHLLREGGVYTSSELGKAGENLYLPLLTMFRSKKVIFPIPSNVKKSLKLMKELLINDQYSPLIDDRQFSIDEVQSAYEYVSSGEKIGNVILSIS